MQFRIVHIRPNRAHLYGATAAQLDLSEISKLFSTLTTDSLIVQLDFRDAESISGSYLRATVLWCLLAGKAHAEGIPASVSNDPWAIRPLPLYPLVIADNPEILSETDDLLKQRALACLGLNAPAQPPFASAALLGTLDEFLLTTLKLLSECGPCTAQTLKERSNETISTGGWSNRLAALIAHRLVTRERDGKSWIYQTLTKHHTSWDWTS